MLAALEKRKTWNRYKKNEEFQMLAALEKRKTLKRYKKIEEF